MYVEAYGLIADAVAAYAKSHEIDLVIRFNSENIDATKQPNQLLESLNRSVVYENNLDITEAIIAAVNEK
jgi:hypothetical protein